MYNGGHPSDLSGIDEWLGHNPAVAVFFVDALTGTSWIETVVDTHLTRLWNQGHVPMLIWQPYVSPREQTPEDIESQIIDGAFDDTIETWATNLASWVKGGSNRELRRRLYFVPAHEMNGDWNPWSSASSANRGMQTSRSENPADYVVMWRRIHRIFDTTPLDERTIQWVWTPNADETSGVQTERFYPGDEYVDWIGLNGYNYGEINNDSRWRTPEDRFGTMVQRMKRLSDKPLALPEVSSTSYVNGTFRPSRKAEWIERLFSFADDEDIKMVSWYNFDNTGEWESDWAIFGGKHGTSSTQVAGESYRVYDEYKRQVERQSTLNSRTDYSQLLTDDEFAGRF
ncbi:endoglucanase family protein [Halococcus saccharolyticus DSM 5350]|uniref:Endoglucanase family protein n=1 Tax=Halococcus saccharolyticus DSM 5350 TaxID=1227455 RepID=M0MNY5_9EURY|nr:endoglucanase family protein [Halococcus saccharolyticus DSM 5350]